MYERRAQEKEMSDDNGKRMRRRRERERERERKVSEWQKRQRCSKSSSDRLYSHDSFISATDGYRINGNLSTLLNISGDN